MKLKSISILESLLRIIAGVTLVGAFFMAAGMIYDIVQHNPLYATPPDTAFRVKNADAFSESLGIGLNDTKTMDTSRVTYEAVHVDAKIKNPSTMAVVGNKLPEIIAALIAAAMAWLLARIVKRARNDDIFARATLRDVRYVFSAFAVLVVGASIVPQIQSAILLNERGFLSPSGIEYSGPLGLTFIGVVIALLGELAVHATRQAVELKEENDATI